MGKLTVAEASAFDLLEALDDAGGRPRFTRTSFGQMARQTSAGWAITLRDDAGVLACVAGLWPEADHVEAWLATGPAFRANLRAALLVLSHHLDHVGREAAPVEVRVYARGGVGGRPGERVAGARMATWLGLRRSGTEATGLGPLQVLTRTFGGQS